MAAHWSTWADCVQATAPRGGRNDTKNKLTDMLAEGNFTRDEWNNILHFQHQSFELHLLRPEFQRDKLRHDDGEKDAGTKGRRKKCGKIEIYSDDVPTNSLSAKSPIASKSLGILIAQGKPESSNSKSDAASSSQARLNDAYFGDTRRILSLQKRNQDVDPSRI